MSASGVGEVVGLDSVSVGLGAEEDGVGSGMLGVGSSSQPRAALRRSTATSARSRVTCTSFPEKADTMETTHSGPG